MQLNELGKNAFQFWMEIPNHFPFIELGNFVVMPNHTHGILIIDKPVEMPNFLGVRCPIFLGGVRCPIWGLWICPIWGLWICPIWAYPRMVTIHNRKINPDFAWQSNYHDHIIRNSKSFENIQNYIENNPNQWKEDRFWKI